MPSEGLKQSPIQVIFCCYFNHVGYYVHNSFKENKIEILRSARTKFYQVRTDGDLDYNDGSQVGDAGMNLGYRG